MKMRCDDFEQKDAEYIQVISTWSGRVGVGFPGESTDAVFYKAIYFENFNVRSVKYEITVKYLRKIISERTSWYLYLIKLRKRQTPNSLF